LKTPKFFASIQEHIKYKFDIGSSHEAIVRAKSEQVVDVLMKSLPNKKLVYFRSMLVLVDNFYLVEREG